MAEDSNVVYIGKKRTLNYAVAILTQFNQGVKEVIVKARGKSISKAVDAVELVKNRFAQDVKVDIEIGTEAVENEGKKLNVSTITIKLTK